MSSDSKHRNSWQDGSAGEVSLCKHEDLSSASQHPHKKPKHRGHMPVTSMLRVGAGSRDRRIMLTGLSSYLVNCSC